MWYLSWKYTTFEHICHRSKCIIILFILRINTIFVCKFNMDKYDKCHIWITFTQHSSRIKSNFSPSAGLRRVSCTLANVFNCFTWEFRILPDKMRPFLVFTLSICVEICCGRYFNRRVFEYKPGVPMRDFALSDEECEDDPNYERGCRRKTKSFCWDHPDFSFIHCRKSCELCPLSWRFFAAS